MKSRVLSLFALALIAAPALAQNPNPPTAAQQAAYTEAGYAIYAMQEAEGWLTTTAASAQSSGASAQAQRTFAIAQPQCRFDKIELGDGKAGIAQVQASTAHDFWTSGTPWKNGANTQWSAAQVKWMMGDYQGAVDMLPLVMFRAECATDDFSRASTLYVSSKSNYDAAWLFYNSAWNFA